MKYAKRLGAVFCFVLIFAATTDAFKCHTCEDKCEATTEEECKAAAAAAPAEGEAPAEPPADARFIQRQGEAFQCVTYEGKNEQGEAAKYKGCSAAGDCAEFKAKMKDGECTACAEELCNSGVYVKPATLPILAFITLTYLISCN